jgi:4-aminobutyrate aminotransferase
MARLSIYRRRFIARVLARQYDAGPMNGIRIRVRPPGPRARAILRKDARYISPAYTRTYPLVVAEGRDVWVRDVDGNVFLDFTSGVAVNVLGHAPPALLRAATAQARRFIHMAGTDFYYGVMADLAERLARLAPGRFPKKVFFTNSGTEAVEAALKLARWATRRPRFVAFLGGFHGRTLGALSLTASKPVHRAGFAPLLPEVTHVPYAYCYRCPLGREPEACAIACVDYIEEWVFRRSTPPEEVAAVVVEPMQGEGGYVLPPRDFLPRLRELCDRHGILLIVDEIQTGFGRSGKMFMVEHTGVVPDILCVAKGIAGGFPLGAMISRADLQRWPSGAHANTFGGNAVACAAALAVLDALENGLMERVAEAGEILGSEAMRLAATYDIAGDARGMGLMWGIEIVRSKATREPAPEIRDRIVHRCFQNGLLLLPAGSSTVRFLPPLTARPAHIRTAMAIFERVLSDEQSRLAHS